MADERGVAKRTPEMVEKAKMYWEMGWKKTKICEELGITYPTLNAWLKRPDPAAETEEMEARRRENRLRYVDEAWKIAHKANDALNRLLDNPKGCTAKELATVSAIMIDKISVIEARRSSEGTTKPPINIVIMPQGEHGSKTGTEQNAVRVYDDEKEILGDDSGCGEWEDLCRLPAGNEDGS